MSDKYLNKYRIPSARAPWWVYGLDGSYFVTICLDDKKQHLFGEISDGEMRLSAVGKIVCDEWEKSFEIRKELFCDAFVIMPNHIHAILRIEQPANPSTDARQCVSDDNNTDIKITNSQTNTVNELGCNIPLNSNALPCNNNINSDALPCVSTGVAYRTPKSISSFVAGFKAAATKNINLYRNTPKQTVWQTRFHDRIIRDNDEFRRIYHYIQTNVENWEQDKFFEE